GELITLRKTAPHGAVLDINCADHLAASNQRDTHYGAQFEERHTFGYAQLWVGAGIADDDWLSGDDHLIQNRRAYLVLGIVHWHRIDAAHHPEIERSALS